MRRLAIFLVFLPLGAFAQDVVVDYESVLRCFSEAPTGNGLPDCLGSSANKCQAVPGNGTTLGIARCIQAETEVWDGFLNQQYRLRREELAKQGAGFSEQLQAVQRAWIAFRDAECGLQFDLWSDGSIRTIVAASCIMDETAERALELRDLGKME